jgi:MFS family permease
MPKKASDGKSELYELYGYDTNDATFCFIQSSYFRGSIVITQTLPIASHNVFTMNSRSQTASLLAVKVVLLYACSLTVMSIATISPSLPRIAAAYSTVPNIEFLTKLLLAVPALFIAVGSPIAGFIVDAGHRKNLLLGSLMLYALAGTSGLYVPEIMQLLIARMFLGLAIAGIMTSAQTLIADYFEGREREIMMGLQGAFTALGGVVFIAVAGVLVDRFGWRASFWLYAASLPLVPLVLTLLSEPERTTAGSNPARTTQTVSSPQEQAAWRVVMLICGTTFVGMAAYYIIPTQLPFFLTSLGIPESAKIGIAIALANLAGGAASLLMPVLHRQLDFRWLVAVSFGAFALGFTGLHYASAYAPALAFVLACGFGVGLLMPAMKLWTMTAAPLTVRGRAIGAMSAAMFLGQFASPILAQSVVAARGITALFAGVAIVMVCVMIAFAVLRGVMAEKPSVMQS